MNEGFTLIVAAISLKQIGKIATTLRLTYIFINNLPDIKMTYTGFVGYHDFHFSA